MKSKRLEIEQVASFLRDGMTLMAGGFMGNGTPPRLIQAVLDSGVKDLTMIVDDTAFLDATKGPEGIGLLVRNKRIKKLITGHIGLNKEAQRQMITGEMEIELNPIGTLAERIRAAGSGLGGVLTPTGVGTLVADYKQDITINGQKFDQKQTININGRDFLLETPLTAELALLEAVKSDKFGNLVYYRTMRNHNPLMALAAQTVIVEAHEVVEIGEIDPDHVMTPGILIDHIVFPA
ncbi:MAG: acetyl-CoA--acetoacetyl-CoA transferase subunit alpha [Azoarcus sp.]|jgi:acetate CoA/acetoacetate CoA-transferase alpha subunit|nr:acetyl-CoA--acetoacetyl-CoA transferase subunit alpha [Azoarcus sp.]